MFAVRMFVYYFESGALQFKDEAEIGNDDCEFAVVFSFSVEEDFDLFFLQLVVASGSWQAFGNVAAEHSSIRVKDDGPAFDFSLNPMCKSKSKICGKEDSNSMRFLVPDFTLIPSISEVNDC